MATVRKFKSGKKFVLLDPSEKAKRYARQMKAGKVHETGKKLSKIDLAYRAGFLDARSESAKAFNSNRKNRRG